MTRLTVSAFCLALALASLRQPLQAAEKPAPRPELRVVVDPRVELMCVLFRLAGNPEYNRCHVDGYAKDVEKRFGPFREHEAVRLAKKLRETHSVSFDACMSMAVHVTDVDKLEEAVPFEPRPHGLDSRWPAAEARAFLTAARRFVQESRFQEFCGAHKDLYQRAQERMKALVDKEAHLEWFGEFFGQRPAASFTVVVALLNGPNNYGVHCRTPDGKEELYSIQGVWLTDDKELPVFGQNELDTLVHEFCHSHANEIIDHHEKELQAAGEKIFPHVAQAMKRQAYGTWKTMMYESLVRASTIRYIRRYNGPLMAWLAIQNQKERQFLWIGDLSDLLEQYENQRDRYPTLEAFAPRIVAFFNDYAAKPAKNPAPKGH